MSRTDKSLDPARAGVRSFDTREEVRYDRKPAKTLADILANAIDSRWSKAIQAARQYPTVFVKWCESNTNRAHLYNGKVGMIVRWLNKGWIGPLLIKVDKTTRSLFVRNFDVCESMYADCRDASKEGNWRKLKELVSADLGWWRVVCISTITSPGFLDKFPPSRKCCSPIEHRDWLFAALIECALMVGCDLTREWSDEIIIQTKEIDKKEGCAVYGKFEYVGNITRSITMDKNFGHDARIEEAFSEIGARNIRWAVVWMLCNKFIKETTTQTDPKTLSFGTRHLFDNFYNMIASSESMDFASRINEGGSQ